MTYALDVGGPEVTRANADMGSGTELVGPDVKVKVSASRPFLGYADVSAQFYARRGGEWVLEYATSGAMQLAASPSFEVNVGGKHVRLRAVFQRD